MAVRKRSFDRDAIVRVTCQTRGGEFRGKHGLPGMSSGLAGAWDVSLLTWRRPPCINRIYVLAKRGPCRPDRKSTRLNSSHLGISYAVFCLKKKNKIDGR